MRTTRWSRFLTTTTVALPLMLGAANAFAGRSQVEFSGGGSPGFGPYGDAWVTTASAAACAGAGAASCGVPFANGTSSGLINLGFTANIGGSAYDAVFMNSSGFVTFTNTQSPDSPYTAAYSPSISSIADLGGTITAPFIAPLYGDLGITAEVRDPFGGNAAGALFFRGSAIPNVTSSSTTADLLPAFAATWFSNTSGIDPLNPQVATQLVLYSTSSGGDFDLRLRYGYDDRAPNVTYSGAVSGFSMGTSVATVANPTNVSDYFYSFVGGVLDSDGGGGPISVPEIDAASAASGLTLLFGTMAVLGGRRRHPRKFAAVRA